jgi:L-lactate dehydrogenase (cytochrome)
MFADKTIHSYADARRLARKRLPWMVFDYIDGAAGEGHGQALNRQVLNGIRLQPRVLVNVEKRDLSAPVFGKAAGLPFGVSPMGMCNLADPDADRFLAAFSARHSVPLGVSTVASTSLEEMAVLSEGNAWFQLYFSGSAAAADQLMDRAKAAGYETLILTVDVPEVGRRPRELRRGFKMPFRIGPQQFLDFACHPQWSLRTVIKGKPGLANFGGRHGEFDRTSSRAGGDWDFLQHVRDRWKGKLVIKGVQHAGDAVRIKSAGADAIQVSSHGSRQLDSAPPPILSLAEIRAAVGQDFPLFFDSGIRCGEDIVKAYALGADFVFLGRALSFAIAAGRAAGLNQMIDVLQEEASIALAQMGLCSLAEAREPGCIAALPGDIQGWRSKGA